VPQKKVPDSASQKSKQQHQQQQAKQGGRSEASSQRVDYESTNQNPRVVKAIESIANKWFSVSNFIQALRSIGLNIFPELDSEKFVTITAKVKFNFFFEA
jgi:hypothetical protein